MKWIFASLVLASAVTVSSTSASAYGYRHHYRSFYNSMNMMPVYGPLSFYNSMNVMPGYWPGYGYYYGASLPGGGMLDPSAALNGSSPGSAAGGP
jgi:hypothetical protein